MEVPVYRVKIRDSRMAYDGKHVPVSIGRGRNQ